MIPCQFQMQFNPYHTFYINVDSHLPDNNSSLSNLTKTANMIPNW